MEPERWQQVKNILHSALEREPGQRGAFLARECGDDESLRREVEAFLAANDQAGSFFEMSAVRLAAEVVAEGGANVPGGKPSVQIGQQLSSYQITSLLGEGGMGEVYRARDLKLKREVAIKILPAEFSRDSDRVSRFQREAEVLASLNHPNIAVIYDLQETAKSRFLVLELVEGETLADRIARGPIPVQEALDIAKNICEALEAAHEKGIIHRDLKPANVKITPDGKVKVLDFGLAKTLAGESARADLSQSPKEGQILGTPAYMSPEQVRGQGVDKRTDIWAFGAVLYEMLTGQRLFAGATASDVLAEVLTKDPDLDRVPAKARKLLRRCLDKDPRQRLRDIGEARFLLEGDTPELRTAHSPSRLSWLSWGAAGVFAVIAAAVALWALWRQPGVAIEERPVQFQISPPLGVTFRLGRDGGSAISPDGRMIAVAGTSSQVSKLWVRSLDSVSLRELPFTDGAQYPFWSPDSRSIGFFAEGKLKRVDLSGGSAFVIADAPDGRGGTWNSEGIIVFAPTAAGRLTRVSASGGTTVAVTESDQANMGPNHRWPEFLPDGRQFLYFSAGQSSGAFLSSLDPPGEKATRLVTTPTNVAYSLLLGQRTGYLLWLRGTTLMAQPFDPVRVRLSGDAVPVPGLGPIASATLYPRSFSVARNGTILVERADQPYQLTWFDRQGRPQNTVGRVDRYTDVHLAPDGNGAAVSLVDSSGLRDIWVLDFARAAYTRVSSGGIGFVSVWSPDGKKVAYNLGGSNLLYTRGANGAAPEEKVLESRFTVFINDWSSDGRYLVYTESPPETKYDLWLLPTFGDRKPVPFLKTAAAEWHGQISPDGKWIAYTSDESGRPDVYVRSFPEGAAKWAVSNSGGSYPRWRRDGKELFYRALDGRLMSASVQPAGQGLEFGSPAALFRLVEPQGVAAYTYDVSPDGKRILALAPSQGTSDIAPLTVLMNWQAALKK